VVDTTKVVAAATAVAAEDTEATGVKKRRGLISSVIYISLLSIVSITC
jgi:hypothetical protein